MHYQPAKEYEPRKLCSRNHPGTQQRTIWLTREALEQLQWLREFYFLVLGQEVSASLVLRRSLELLKAGIKGHISRGDLSAIHEEGARLKELR